MGTCEDFMNYYYMDYMKSALQSGVNSLYWQGRASEITLWVVYAISTSGVILAAVQLYMGYKLGVVPQNSDISLDGSKASLKSSFVGVIILFLSFLFFIVFVREVYTMKPLEIPGAPQFSFSCAPVKAASSQSPGTAPGEAPRNYPMGNAKGF